MIPGAVEAIVLVDGRVGGILLPGTPDVQHPRPRESPLRNEDEEYQNASNASRYGRVTGRSANS